MTSTRKSPEVRARMFTYTASVVRSSTHTAEKLDRAASVCTRGARHDAPGDWVAAPGNRSLSLVSTTTTVTGYGVLRTTVMGTLAVPAVSRIVSERTASRWSWFSRAVSYPATAACCWPSVSTLDSAPRRRSPSVWAVSDPRAVADTALSKPSWRARAVRRARPGTAAGVSAAGRLVSGCPSAPTGTWAKSWSRVTGVTTGFPCRPARAALTKAGEGDHSGGATATTPRGAGVPPGPRRLGTSS
ncbi:MAG: hypothetical protein ABSG81_10800 [Acidimicrobiales bacterium]